MRQLHCVMSVTREFTIRLEKDPDSGWYSVQCIELPEAISQGETKKEALQNIKEAISLVLEERRESARKKGDRLVVVTI